MSTMILNTGWEHPADGWYQLEFKNDHPNSRAGVVQVIDDTACASIVNRFNAEASKPGFPGMIIDQDHFKHDPDKPTTAFGWLMRLQNRADGFFGKIRWTSTGQKAVDGGDLRFFSTEYDQNDCQVLNAANPRRIRPMRLNGLTLTNMPNNKGQTPITNRTNNPMNTSTLQDGGDDSARLAVQSAICQYRMAHPKATFDDAWNNVRRTAPSLFNRSPGAIAAQSAHNRDASPTVPFIPSIAQQDERNELVKQIRNRKPSLTFDQAWQVARKQRPDLWGMDRVQ